MIDDPISRLIDSALQRHAARDHRKGIPAIVQAVDTTNRLADVFLKDEQLLADKIPYDADLYLAVGDQVLVDVQGGRSYFIRAKSNPIGGAVPSLGSALVLIKSTTLTVAAATVDFTSIPQGFKHLLLELQARGDTAATFTDVFVTFNGDTGANYDREAMIASGAVAPADTEVFAGTNIRIGHVVAATGPANASDQIVAEIANYAATTFQKTLSSKGTLKVGVAAGNLSVYLTAAWWRSTAAISSLSVFPTPGNFVAGSTFSLYGMR